MDAITLQNRWNTDEVNFAISNIDDYFLQLEKYNKSNQKVSTVLTFKDPISSLKKYITDTDTFQRINSILRSNYKSSTHDYTLMINDIDDIIGNSSLEDDIVLYRAIDIGELGKNSEIFQMFANLKKGDMWKDKAYLSTTSFPMVLYKNQISIVINIKSGMKGICLDHFDILNEDNNEYLLNRNTILYVNNVIVDENNIVVNTTMME